MCAILIKRVVSCIPLRLIIIFALDETQKALKHEWRQSMRYSLYSMIIDFIRLLFSKQVTVTCQNNITNSHSIYNKILSNPVVWRVMFVGNRWNLYRAEMKAILDYYPQQTSNESQIYIQWLTIERSYTVVWIIVLAWDEIQTELKRKRCQLWWHCYYSQNSSNASMAIDFHYPLQQAMMQATITY